MLTAFWEGVGTQFASRWATQILSPGFLFWLAVVGAWFVHSDCSLTDVENFFDERSDFVSGLLIFAALLLVFLTGAVARWLARPLLRVLAGYWGKSLGWLADRRRKRLSDRFDAQRQEWNDLTEPQTWLERQRYVHLDLILRQSPNDPNERMPTRFGNLLRAGESRVREKYGLDATVCWPRLWLLLNEQARNDVDQFQARLQTAAQAALLSLFLCPLVVWTIWALIAGLLFAVVSYLVLLRYADSYMQVIESVFDVNRLDLYQALRWPLPKNPKGERAAGVKLTQYLWRGAGETTPRFAAPED